MSEADLTIRPMAIGAEVSGLTQGSVADTSVRQALYDAWLDHGFLLFRDVDSVEKHIAISRCFGELEIHPVPEVRFKDNAYLIEIGAPSASGRPPVYVFDDKDPRVNRIAWHRDTAYTPDICKGSMLRMVEVPAHEGETMLADTAMAWNDLPTDLQAQLETLEYKATIRTDHMTTLGHPGVFWSSVRPASEDEDPGGAAKRGRTSGIDGRYPSVIQPAVIVHPESGRKCLFLSPTYVDFFVGLSPSESEELLWRLTEHMLSDKYVYAHRWRVNDAIIWDNRRCLHAGRGNRVDEPRYGLRTTLAGPTRTGRYFDPDASAPTLSLAMD